MDIHTTRQFVEQAWTDTIIPTLTDYLRIPNQSPAYDPDWNTNGYIDQAVELLAEQKAAMAQNAESDRGNPQ